MSEPEPIDRERLKLLGLGRTAQVYRYGNDRVVKIFRTAFPRQAIENEFLVCRTIGDLIAIPRAHARVTVDGCDAIVFDYIEGESGFKYLFRNPWRLRRLAEEFASIHAKMHEITVPESVPGTKSILVRNIGLHDLLPEATKRRILDGLRELPDRDSLCHGDYHPENLLLRDGKAFVIDWMTGTRGNPLADVARTSVLLKWAFPGPGTPGVIRAGLGAIRGSFYRYYVRRYCELTGIRTGDVERWEIPVLAARLMEWIPDGEKKLLISLISDKLAHS